MFDKNIVILSKRMSQDEKTSCNLRSMLHWTPRNSGKFPIPTFYCAILLFLSKIIARSEIIENFSHWGVKNNLIIWIKEDQKFLAFKFSHFTQELPILTTRLVMHFPIITNAKKKLLPAHNFTWRILWKMFVYYGQIKKTYINSVGTTLYKRTTWNIKRR